MNGIYFDLYFLLDVSLSAVTVAIIHLLWLLVGWVFLFFWLFFLECSI